VRCERTTGACDPNLQKLEPQTALDSSSRGGGDGGRKLEAEALQAGRELKGVFFGKRVEVTEHASTGGSSKRLQG
jgi:hypothetical protein